MEMQVSPQLQVVGEEPDKPTYASQLLHQQNTQTKTKLKPVQYIHGEPTIQFTFKELEHFTIEEGLHQAIVMKLSFGAPSVKDLRSLIPKQLAIKGRCLIGSLANRHLLLRFDLNEDYVGVLSKQVGFIQFNGEQHQFRTFPWTQWFDPKEETSKALVWVSFPELPPNMFAKVPLLSIASVVGKPIAIDRATQDRTRPSTARVKVITDILDKHPKRIRLHYLDEVSGKLIEHYQEVVFDNLPLYCIACKHQGHEDEAALRGNVLIDKYKGDAREIINDKRRAGGTNQDERATLNTIAAGKVGNTGQKTDAPHSAGVSAAGVNVVSQQGNNQKQNMGENATVTSGNDQHTNNGNDGDQLIAKVAITDPKQTVSNVQALAVNVAMEMGCKIDERLGQQLVAGIGNGTTVGFDQNYIVDVVSASTNDCVVEMDGQTTDKEQYNVNKPARNSGMQNQVSMGQDGNTKKNGKYDNEAALQNKKARGVDKGKTVMVYREKGNTTLPVSKPTGIRICEPKSPSLLKPVVSDGSASAEEFAGKMNPVHQVRELLALAYTSAMEMNGKTDERSVRQNIGNEQLQNKGVSTEGNRQVVTDTMEAVAINNRQQISIAKSGDSLVPVESPGHDVEHKKYGDGNGGHQPLFAESVINDQPQQEGNSHFACHHTKLGDACDGQQIIRTLDQNAENTCQIDNADSESHTLDTASMNNSSNENFEIAHIHQLVDINMMHNVVTGGQHHNSSNWAVLVEEEDDNIGLFELLYKEESEKKTQTNPNTDNNVLNPNAPEFTPHKTQGGKQVIQGKLQEIDKELLDALVHVNPLEMKYACNISFPNYYRELAGFNSDAEDGQLDKFYQKSVMKAGIPPWQQRSRKATNTNTPHVGNLKGDEEETVPRQLPMRQAKLKGGGSSSSTRTNKSKKKKTDEFSGFSQR